MPAVPTEVVLEQYQLKSTFFAEKLKTLGFFQFASKIQKIIDDQGKTFNWISAISQLEMAAQPRMPVRPKETKTGIPNPSMIRTTGTLIVTAITGSTIRITFANNCSDSLPIFLSWNCHEVL